MAFANDPPVRQITLPNGTTTGTQRIVIGSDTPPELQSYGMTSALLFYVTDKVTGIEVGYFFIGLSNALDSGGNNLTLLNGEVLYPVPGNPGSATAANVKTLYQMTMNDGTGGIGAGTYFKDYPIILQTTVSDFTMGWQTKINRDGHDMGGGWVAGGIITVDNPTVTTAGDVVQITCLDEFGNTPTFRANRAYEARLSCEVKTDIVGSAPILRLRKTNAAGTDLGSSRAGPTVNNFYFGFTYNYTFQVGGSDVSAPLVICLQGLAGHILQMGAVDDFSRCNIYEIGPASGSRSSFKVLT